MDPASDNEESYTLFKVMVHCNTMIVYIKRACYMWQVKNRSLKEELEEEAWKGLQIMLQYI